VVGAIVCSACGSALLGPKPSVDRSAVFEQIWSQLDLHYSYFQLRGVNWDTVGAAYRPRAIAAATDYEFATQVGNMLRELKDVHVSLTPGAQGSTLAYISPYDTLPAYFSKQVVFESYVRDSAQTSGKHLEYGHAAVDVGYVRIASFAGSDWAAEIDEALDSLKSVKSMIVDIRDNRGGDVGLAVNIAGRFLAAERTYGYVRTRNGPKHTDFTDYSAETVKPTGKAKFRGSVFVLTNRKDFSSAEDFVLAMRTIPRVTIVGDTTAGASGGPIQRELANGWRYELSEWIEYTPAKKMFEGVGLAPDVFVRAVEGKDLILERAIALSRY